MTNLCSDYGSRINIIVRMKRGNVEISSPSCETNPTTTITLRQTVLDALPAALFPINLSLAAYMQSYILSAEDFSEIHAEFSRKGGDVWQTWTTSRVVFQVAASEVKEKNNGGSSSAQKQSHGESISSIKDKIFRPRAQPQSKETYQEAICILIKERVEEQGKRKLANQKSDHYASLDLMARGFAFKREVVRNTASTKRASTSSLSRSKSVTSSTTTTAHNELSNWPVMASVSRDEITYNHNNSGAELLIRVGGPWEFIGMRVGGSCLRRVFNGPCYGERGKRFWSGEGSARVFVKLGSGSVEQRNNYYQISGEPLTSYSYGTDSQRVLTKNNEAKYGPDGQLPRWRLFYSSMYQKHVGFPSSHWISAPPPPSLNTHAQMSTTPMSTTPMSTTQVSTCTQKSLTQTTSTTHSLTEEVLEDDGGDFMSLFFGHRVGSILGNSSAGGSAGTSKIGETGPSTAGILDLCEELNLDCKGSKNLDCKGSKKRKKRKKQNELRARLGQIVVQLRRNNKKLDYHRLLNKHCPLPGDLLTTTDLKVAVKWYSQLKSVNDWVREVFSSLLPLELFGSERNKVKIIDNLIVFCNKRRMESMSVSDVMTDIHVNDVLWLLPDNKPQSLPASSHIARTKMVQKLVYLFFASIAIPLLRCTFYVTETEFQRGAIFFYRKPCWSKVRDLAMVGFGNDAGNTSKKEESGEGESVGGLDGEGSEDTVFEMGESSSVPPQPPPPPPPIKGQYRLVSKEEILERVQSQKCGASQLRLLPKNSGIRGIATLSKRRKIDPPKKSENNCNNSSNNNSNGNDRTALSTNAILRPAYDVLKYEYSRNTKLFGAGVNDFEEVFAKFAKFKHELRRNETKSKSLPKLYFATADIKHCYDKINQEYLFELIKEKVLNEDTYFTQKYSVLHPYRSRNKIQGKNTALMSCQADWQDFLEKATKDHANNYNNAVIVDKVYLPARRKDEIVELLREHIFSHFVVASSGRGRDSYLLQNEGIAQGSVLSTIMCNMYYGSVKEKLLEGVYSSGDSDQNLLVRRADDFILVTTNLNVAKRFLSKMEEGVPELGAQINMDKTTLNFDFKHLKKNSKKKPDIQWCGFLFDTETLEVQFDVERFWGSNALDNLKIESSKNPGVSLKSKMKTFVRPRCTPLLLHTHVNSTKKIKQNLYQIFLLGAIKSYGYVIG